MIAAERREKILELVAEKNFADVDMLAESVDVSPATIRRDLLELESSGHVERVHGGVVFRHHPGINQILPLSQREVKFLEEKEAIGRRAASLVNDGETIILDGGTTTYQVARNLRDKHLQIITNSLSIANVFTDSVNVELLLLGGILYPKRGVFLGPFAEEAIKKIYAHKCFIGTGGIVKEGITNTDVLTAELERDIIKNSREVIVVADHGKWNTRSTCFIEELSRINKIVTDRKPADSDLKDALRKCAVEVVLSSDKEI